MASLDTINTTSNNVGDAAQELHTFKAYDPQLSIPVKEGERLVKCLYKKNMKTGTVAGENSYIIVPESHLAEEVVIENVAMLAPYISAYLQSVEDGIIKEHHKNGGKGFSDRFLSLAKILETLDIAGQGSRLNKEKIEAWFASDVQTPLIEAFADKMGIGAEGKEPTEQELEKLALITSVYRARFASLASGKTAYRKEEAELLQKALTVTGAVESSSIGARFFERLEKMKTATSEDLLMSL